TNSGLAVIGCPDERQQHIAPITYRGARQRPLTAQTGSSQRRCRTSVQQPIWTVRIQEWTWLADLLKLDSSIWRTFRSRVSSTPPPTFSSYAERTVPGDHTAPEQATPQRTKSAPRAAGRVVLAARMRPHQSGLDFVADALPAASGRVRPSLCKVLP